jgi:hypothetical protein
MRVIRTAAAQLGPSCPRPHPEVPTKWASMEGSRDRRDNWRPPSRSVHLFTMRVIRTAAAQLGPIQKAEGRDSVVARMIALMDDDAVAALGLLNGPELGGGGADHAHGKMSYEYLSDDDLEGGLQLSRRSLEPSIEAHFVGTSG